MQRMRGGAGARLALLHRLRDRDGRLRRPAAPALRPPRLLLAAAFLLLLPACEPDPRLQPDELLQSELGLTLRDRVYRVSVTGGEVERADPVALRVEPGAYVEFVTDDWLVHEIVFEADALEPDQWAFLERTDQVASPPLIDRGSRYVLHFEGAPSGRYLYTLEGNGRAGQGAIIVASPEGR